MIDIAKEAILLTINKYEGHTYTNNPLDRGGPTKYGITLATLRRYYGSNKITAEDVKNLTLDQAVSVYRKLFWKDLGIGLLPLELQHITFDMCVLHGEGRGPKLLQKAIRNLFGDRPAIDGAIGPKTAAACKAALAKWSEKEVIQSIVDVRVKFMNGIVANDPSQKTFINGWLTRANSFLAATPLIYVPKEKDKSNVNIKPSFSRGKKS